MLSKTTSFRENSNHSHVSSVMGQRSNIDCVTAVCLQRRDQDKNRQVIVSQEMALPFKHILAVILYTMSLFWRRSNIHGMVRIYMCPKKTLSIPAVMLFRGCHRIFFLPTTASSGLSLGWTGSRYLAVLIELLR